ncbi:MAG TPA: multicopper oxidase family protein [Dongiaceae bacterium]
MIPRRTFLTGIGGVAAAAALPLAWPRAQQAGLPGVLSPVPSAMEAGVRTFKLRAREAQLPLLGADGPRTPLWLYADAPLPVIRVARGEPVRVRFTNGLPAEHSSIHWHGVRVANAMDGVPYITQPPVQTGSSFDYEFAPPDAGSFFFHPHCNEAGQVGHGLAGILIVDGDEGEPFDGDVILAAKDWRLAPDGSFLPFSTIKGASGAGTFGKLRTVNGAAAFARNVPASADLRLRLYNLDATRVLEVGVEGAEALVIAIDGNAVAPFVLDTWRMGPAMRLDLAVRSPAAGRSFKVIDYGAADLHDLAVLTSEGAPLRTRAFKPAPLVASPIPAPDLAAAETQTYLFGAASDSIASFVGSLDPDDPLSAVILDSLCTGEETFWSINKLSWPRDGHEKLPPPLARLAAGKSYRFILQNGTPHPHPIHLHGHTFTVLSSSRRQIPVHRADTVLTIPKERVEIAFVAREGDWMLHCHILEHLETGMMGYVRVT